MRRDSNDLKWQDVKKEIRSRDKNRDRIFCILTVKEALLLQKKASRNQLEKLDAAHIFPCGLYGELIYNINNIVLLNRYSHEALDNMRDPITNEPITYEERQEWWKRIAKEKQWSILMNLLGDNINSSS